MPFSSCIHQVVSCTNKLLGTPNLLSEHFCGGVWNGDKSPHIKGKPLSYFHCWNLPRLESCPECSESQEQHFSTSTTDTAEKGLCCGNKNGGHNHLPRFASHLSTSAGWSAQRMLRYLRNLWHREAVCFLFCRAKPWAWLFQPAFQIPNWMPIWGIQSAKLQLTFTNTTMLIMTLSFLSEVIQLSTAQTP